MLNGDESRNAVPTLCNHKALLAVAGAIEHVGK